MEESEKEPDDYYFIGKNKNHICLLVHFSEETVISNINLQFITRMLEACKLTLDDVAILNYNNKPIKIRELKIQLQPAYIILFGVSPQDIDLPVNFPLYKPQAYDAITYLYTPPLDRVNQDNDEGKLLKSKLWVCLRQLFQV